MDTNKNKINNRIDFPCACVHSDARTCARWRDGAEPDDPHYYPRECECSCHSIDRDDEEFPETAPQR